MSEWIAMKDRKPRHGQRVIYYSDKVGMRIGQHIKTEIGFCFLTNDVTHWMPAPKPPTRGKKRKVE